MLTNDQALEIIKRHNECYVVWATDKNVIVAVHPIPPNATAKDRLTALAAMSTDYNGPTKGRFLSAASTTLQTLIDESKETDRIASRVEIFNSWKNCTVDQLIDIVVKADFSEPMDVFHGTSHLVERLYKIYGPFLATHQIDRLDGFARSAISHPEQQKGHEELQCLARSFAVIAAGQSQRNMADQRARTNPVTASRRSTNKYAESWTQMDGTSASTVAFVILVQ